MIKLNIMPIPVGEKIWLLRDIDNTGNPALYTPSTLLQKFKEYYQWAQDNPIFSTQMTSKGDLVDVPKMRAMSVKAFCLFAGIAQNTFYGYKKLETYTPICQVIQDAIYTQKFEGAAAGLLSAPIMVRDLGLEELVSHRVEEHRKGIDELFPDDDEILALPVEQTDLSEIQKLNSNSYGAPDEQKLHVPGTAGEES